MNKELVITIDMDKLTSDLLEKELYSNGASVNVTLQDEIKKEIKNQIKQRVVFEITRELNIQELREQGYSKEYLTSTARELLSKSLNSLVEENVKTYLDKYLEQKIARMTDGAIEDAVLPRIQKVIDNLLVVNPNNAIETGDE